ncbi:MAG: 50S ribosome-binding GTPase [Planctomycetaceae bacterium]|nr:50S ribosome-binding GTPase [Planctomycetaceae bacterium]
MNSSLRSDATTVAILTPPGRGAVATIGLRGPRAIEIVGRRFISAAGSPLDAFPLGRVVFGRFRGPGGAEEELVVGLIAADDVEVHCHGGIAAAEAVAAALAEEGATHIDFPAWTALAEPDCLAAEARVALSQARTERTAAVLLDQYRGALRAAAEQIDCSLGHHDLASAAEGLRQLLDRAELGRHLARPWRVVLAGRPNAGKSSLMNALLGFQRSIVFAEPGTTRDVLTHTTAFDGWPVELADTAGLRASGEPIEAEGVERALEQVREADLVLLVCDVTTPWSSQEREVLAIARRAMVVHHKCDLGLVDGGEAGPPLDGRPAGIAASSLTGQGIDLVCQRIAQALVPSPPDAGTAVPFTERQENLLRQALAAAINSQPQLAIEALGGLFPLDRLSTK